MASSPEDSATAKASSARASRRSRELPWASSEQRVVSTSDLSGEVGIEQVECPTEDLDLFDVGGADSTVEAAVVGQRCGYDPLGVAHLVCSSSSIEEGFTKCRVARLALCRTEPDGQVESQYRVGMVGAGVEVECLAVVTEGLSGGERLEGCVPCLPGIVECLGQVDGL